MPRGGLRGRRGPLPPPPARGARPPRNLGPGGARQAGIDATGNPYSTCLDADDACSGPSSLRLLRDAMDADGTVQRCGGWLAFLDGSGEEVRRRAPGASMDGMLFRRSFVERYGLRFNETRTSEDYGYNLAADLLCDNGAERTAAVGEVVVNVCGRPGSITSAAGRNFEWDQRVCGFVDNTIWAVDLARRHRPGSDRVTRSILHALLVVYVKLCCIQAQAPWYAEQAMEYAKKFYHLCYRRWYVPAFASMEEKLGPETTGVIIRAFAGQDYLTPPADFEPELGFDEFMGILRTEEYDPDRIFDVWERMSESPELRALMDANEETGACARGYRERR